MLLLHYKQQLSFESISQIIGIATGEVSRCCTNFARIFSEKKVLMEVIDADSEKQRLRVGISSAFSLASTSVMNRKWGLLFIAPRLISLIFAMVLSLFR